MHNEKDIIGHITGNVAVDFDGVELNPNGEFPGEPSPGWQAHRAPQHGREQREAVPSAVSTRRDSLIAKRAAEGRVRSY